MGTTELSTLMHAGAAAQRPSPPDLDAIRRGGTRLRLRRRLAVAGGAAAAVALLGGAVGVALDAGSGGGDGSVTLGQPHEVTGLTAYESRVLREVSGSYAVDGTVIVPGVSGGFGLDQPVDDQLVGSPRPLGFHAYAGGALMDASLPDFLHGNPPKNSQVLGDQGEAFLGCVRWGADRCTVSVLQRDSAGRFQLDYGLGTEKFLTEGSEMEVFTGADYSEHAFRATVIGGFPGVEASRVEVTTVDGQTVDATLDRGGYRAGDTLFWATLPEEAARITAYDDRGQIVAAHTVRACSDPVDCEVR